MNDLLIDYQNLKSVLRHNSIAPCQNASCTDIIMCYL